MLSPSFSIWDHFSSYYYNTIKLQNHSDFYLRHFGTVFLIIESYPYGVLRYVCKMKYEFEFQIEITSELQLDIFKYSEFSAGIRLHLKQIFFILKTLLLCVSFINVVLLV